MEMINAIGRRKASVARVYLTKGDGKISVNGRELKDYFPQKHIQATVMDPFQTVEVENIYDLKVNVSGGGFKGQAEAVRLAISKALVEVNEDYRSPLMPEWLNVRSTVSLKHGRVSSSPNVNIWNWLPESLLPIYH